MQVLESAMQKFERPHHQRILQQLGGYSKNSLESVV